MDNARRRNSRDVVSPHQLGFIVINSEGMLIDASPRRRSRRTDRLVAIQRLFFIGSWGHHSLSVDAKKQQIDFQPHSLPPRGARLPWACVCSKFTDRTPLQT